MNKRFRINLVIAGFLLMISIIGSVTAVTLAPSWQERPADESTFSGAMISRDGSMVFASGNQLFVRSWDGDTRWGGISGTVATMSTDGNYIVSAVNDNVRKINKTGTEIWNRITGSPFRAVAVSGDGSLVIAADTRGYLRSWTIDGKNLGVDNDTDQVKQIKISPSQSLVVVSTEEKLKVFSPELNLKWENNTFGNLDSFIAFSSDSRTLILSGEKRVSSYTADGSQNWVKEVTRDAIIDMACSDDCSTIVLGSQDGNIWVLNREGQVRWKYPAGAWVNGVGVSHDGSVIVAGALDGTVYALDKDGTLLVKTKTDSVIQPRSLAVSWDGTRIVVVDERTMYGYDLVGFPEVTYKETPVQTTLCPCTTTTPAPIKTTLLTTVPSTIMTKIPETTGTPESGLPPFLAIVALAGLYIVIRRNN
jgi:PQQ-like domain